MGQNNDFNHQKNITEFGQNFKNGKKCTPFSEFDSESKVRIYTVQICLRLTVFHLHKYHVSWLQIIPKGCIDRILRGVCK